MFIKMLHSRQNDSFRARIIIDSSDLIMKENGLHEYNVTFDNDNQ